MSVLTDGDIISEMRHGGLKIAPIADGAIQPASVDVHLSSAFRVFVNHSQACIDPMENQTGLTRLIDTTGDAFIIHPGEFVLGSTIEHFGIPSHLVARLEGKSSIARLGLIIHAAGFVDPGFRGTLTLELGNISKLPIKLHPGMPIGQVAIMRMSGRCLQPYGSEGLGSKYQDQVDPMASKFYENTLA